MRDASRRTVSLRLLQSSAFALISAGAFAIVQGTTGHFLPHDEAFLQMSASDLCSVNGCRIVHFMIHDRVSFGGTLIAIGVLYFWLVSVPLRNGESWSWWALAASATIGFASFLAYLGYGYLDTWHGVATLALLIVFSLGLAGSRRVLRIRNAARHPWSHPSWRSPSGLGRMLLLGTSAGLIVGGVTIMIVGMTCVFVPQDLAYLGMEASELRALNPRLVPLIAHDRAGFGGAVCETGVVLCYCARFGNDSRGLWYALAMAGIAGFGSAIGVHPAIGYDDAVHLAPAVLGAFTCASGLVLTFRSMTGLKVVR